MLCLRLVYHLSKTYLRLDLCLFLVFRHFGGAKIRLFSDITKEKAHQFDGLFYGALV